MKRTIQKVAVLGSGIMGSRIACHFANIGVEVLLLDMVPKQLSETEKALGLTLEVKSVRNRIVQDSFSQTIKSKPSPLYKEEFATRVNVGNFDDDLQKITDYDWVIEVIIENLEIKRSLYEKVEKYRKPGTIISSNTSGIPIHMMAEGRSEDFKRNFVGTHFFNPPRYLRLLEIIPTPFTDPTIVDFLLSYGDLFLGKETVLCKDTPAFIANRIGIYSLMSALHYIEKTDFTVGAIDKLTGPVIGRAKSATFRTLDVVGLDTAVHVSNNLYSGCPNDESRNAFLLPILVKEMFEKKWLGDKTQQGFYKKITNSETGAKEFHEINLKTMVYEAPKKEKFDALEIVKGIEDVKVRLPKLINLSDKVGTFYQATFFDVFRYCTFRIPEIADELYKIDQAMCAGFGWEVGPFETWDLLGVKSTLEKMTKMGHEPAGWVLSMIQKGFDSFYIFKNGQKYFYDIVSQDYKKIPGTEAFVLLDAFKDKIVWKNAGSTLYDIGDGIINLEFHTKMNSISSEVIEGINQSIKIAEKDFKGLVIGNESENFSAGANLAMLFMYAGDQDWEEINMMINVFQQTMMRARYSHIPVVAATSGLALGGGCELSLHCDAIQAHAESYIGLVEFGVGLIPAGGGTKELTLRASNEFESGDVELNTLQNFFMNIATAKVATSAWEAKDMKILRSQDSITINRKRVIADAKAKAIQMYNNGYSMPQQRKDIKVLGTSALALFEAGITGMRYGSYISDHDAKIARKLAWVMAGGDLSSPSLVSEQYLLDLEREAFLSLCGEQKTLERIHSILFKGKPLRN